MHIAAKLVVLPAVLWLAIQPASGQEACDIIRSSGQTITRALYMIGADQKPHLLDRFTNISADRSSAPLLLAYKLRPRRHPHPGAIVVKIARKDPSSTDTLPTSIRIVRGGYNRVCGTRDIRDFFFWNSARPPIDAQIPLAEYIYYHKTSSDFDQIALHDLHIDYRNIKGVCVATDDTANGNRQEFLYGDSHDRIADNTLILDNLQSALATAAQAAIPDSQKIFKNLHLDRKLQSIIDRYRKLGQLETVLYPYQPDTDCISLRVEPGASGDSISVILSDLERRDKHKQRIEQKWDFNLRQEPSRR